MFGSPRKEGGFRMQIVQMEDHGQGDQTIDFSVSQNAQPPPPIATHLSGRFGLFNNLNAGTTSAAAANHSTSNQENVDTTSFNLPYQQ